MLLTGNTKCDLRHIASKALSNILVRPRIYTAATFGLSIPGYFVRRATETLGSPHSIETQMVHFFIQRPVFASAIAGIMVLAGLICYQLLPVAQFPEITPPQVVVTAAYPGASSKVVADTVTTPLEQQINGVPGMAYMSSISANDGTSIITVTFDVGYPVNIAAVDVQNRVSQAAASLPSIVNQAGVVIQKKNPNFALAINIYSPDGS